MSEEKQTHKTLEIIELLDCPDCGAKAKDYCIIEIIKDRWQTEVPLSGKKGAQAKCGKCGYCISVSTHGDLKIIRKLWNVRSI